MFHVAVSRAQYLVAAKATYTWDIFKCIYKYGSQWQIIGVWESGNQ